MGIFSGWHLFIVLLIVLVVFGAGKLPTVMRDLGRGVKSFKDAMSEKEAEHPESPPVVRSTIEGEVKKDAV